MTDLDRLDRKSLIAEAYVLRAERRLLIAALRDISREPEGDEQSAQAVAREVLRALGEQEPEPAPAPSCSYPSCVDESGRCARLFAGECAGPKGARS
jgi:hypothetical protein